MRTENKSPLNDELRETLASLAEGLFPLADWIAEKVRKNGYTPPAPDLPWRQPKQTLTPKAMGVIAFLEELLRDSKAQEGLVARWQAIEKDPIASSPIRGLRPWRAKRKLGAAKFAIAASDNILTDADKKPTPREAFYAPYWPLLQKAVKAAKPQARQDWQTLAANLFAGASEHWPAGPLRSDVFVKQFARDMLQAMLGMRNPAPDPWRLALLMELGEHRRTGNAYTPADAQRFVDAFKQKLP